MPEVREGLKPLAEEAVKYDTFDEFERAFLTEIKHGRYYHITDNPNFELDPTKVPTDMSSLAGEGLQEPGFMITSDLPTWAEEFPERLYVAIIDMSQVPKEAYSQVKRGFGNEFWVDDLFKVHVEKIVSMEEAQKDFAFHQGILEAEIQGTPDLKQFYERVKGIEAKPLAVEEVKKGGNPMTEESSKSKCNPDDILCQMVALSHLKGLQSALGDERFKSKFPELEGLDERIAARIKEQDVSLKEAFESCGLTPIVESATETTEEE